MKTIYMIGVIALLGAMMAIPAAAHFPGAVIHSNWAATTPTIDGVKSAGEWDDAWTDTVTMYEEWAVPPTCSIDVTIFVKNDGTNLYFAWEVPDATEDEIDYVNIFFDDGNDGILVEGCEDNKAFWDPATGWWDEHYPWGEADDVFHGDGNRGWADGKWFWEYEIPLNSGDPQDTSASPGDALGVWFEQSDAAGVCPCTYWPGPETTVGGDVFDATTYGDLILASGGSAETGCVAETGTSEEGTVYGCGDLVNCSCTFNGNLTCNPAGGLIVNSNGIVIDGSGYTITGTATPADCEWCGADAPCTVSGIYNAGFDDVVIENLEIENFCTGISLNGTGANKIRNNTVDNCEIHDNGFNTTSGGSDMTTHGIHACNIDGTVDEPALTIIDNEIYNNEGTGSMEVAGGDGIFIYAGSPGTKHEYCNISCNKLHDNAKAGFLTKKALDQSKITHNEIWGNGNGAGITDTVRGGIVLRCKMSNKNLIAHNDIHDHTAEGYGYGIYVGGSNNTIEYNTVNNNSKHGISMARSDGSFDNVLNENTVCDNGVDISTFGPLSDTIGDNNTCDTTSNYDDDGASGCTWTCTPSTPFVIYGWVNCTSGSPVNDPNVTVTNLNTSEIFIAETNVSSNYYRISTSSDHISAGNVLHFNVSNNEFDHPVTQGEMDAGGFEQNVTIECGPVGICGDVTCDGVVDTGDVILLSNFVGYYPGNPAYALNSTQKWAGDVTGNCVIDTGDVILLSNFVGYPGYTLHCNSSCTR